MARKLKRPDRDRNLKTKDGERMERNEEESKQKLPVVSRENAFCAVRMPRVSMKSSLLLRQLCAVPTDVLFINFNIARGTSLRFVHYNSRYVQSAATSLFQPLFFRTLGFMRSAEQRRINLACSFNLSRRAITHREFRFDLLNMHAFHFDCGPSRS